MFLGEGVNEYGTEVTLHRCDTCGGEFSVCPSVPEDTRNQWGNCLSEDCDSYEPTRDAELYFGLGMVAADGFVL